MSTSTGERCKYVSTRKGGNALMHNGYAYYKVRNGENGRVFWKCVKLDCKARISTVNDYIASCRHEHNHPTEAEENKNWIRNRRRPTAVKSAEKFAEKIAQGNLPPIPTIPNVPSLSSIGLPTTSNLCSESTPSSCASTNSALNIVATDTGRTLASHLMPEAKRLRTESGPSPVPVHIPVTQTSHHHKQPTSQTPHLTVSLHPSSSPLTTTHLIHSSPPILSQTHYSTPSSVVVTTNGASHGSTNASSNTTSGRSSPVSVSVITNGVGTPENSLLVKVRISGSGESDFVEVDVPSLTYTSLLKSISEELEVTANEITKIRKLPNVWIRKDRDVQRLKEGQELEVIVKSSTSTITTPPPITSILAVNPFSVAQSHSTNAFSLLSSVASAHGLGHHGGTGLATLRTDNDGSLLSALTSDGPVSMPDLSNVGGANGSSNGLH